MSRLPIRSLLFGGTALAFAAVTVWLGQSVLADGRAPDAPPPKMAEVPARTVLVALRSLAAGAVVAPGDLGWRPWPATGIADAFIASGERRITDFTGHVARSPLFAGEPVTAERLAAPGSRGPLAVVLRPGQRAVSIAVTPTSGVSGLVVPGDRVDVILTYALPQSAAAGGAASFERRAATTILSDLRVLAIDQQLTRAASEKEPRNASLEVTPRQSETLALAADLGKLSLSLRGLERGDADAPREIGGSTLDYQVGRLLPGLGARRATGGLGGPGRAAPRPALQQFHGSNSGAAGTS